MGTWKNNLIGSIGDSASPLWAVDRIIRDLSQPQVDALHSLRMDSSAPIAGVTVAALQRRRLLYTQLAGEVKLTADGAEVAFRIGYLLIGNMEEVTLVSGPHATERAIVMVGLDGASQPIYRYQDELS